MTEVLDSLPPINTRIGYPIDYYEAALSKIAQEKEQQLEYYTTLLWKLCIYLQEHEWTREGYDTIIRTLLEVLPNVAFWQFAVCIGQHLSSYDYQTASRNIQLLLKLHLHNNPAALANLLTDELASQRLWVTGNNHINVPLETVQPTTNSSLPSSIQEASLQILLEQINSQNTRKIESAIFAITLLGQQFAVVMDFIADNWDLYSQIQIEFLLYAITRWAIEGRCSEKLCATLKSAYEKSSDLTMKYRLHSILLHLGIPGIIAEHIDFIADAQVHTLPSEGIEQEESCYPHFIHLIKLVLPPTTIKSLHYYLYNISPLLSYHTDPYQGLCDMMLPVISSIPGEIFYQLEKDAALSALPLILKKGRFITSDDPFIITSMPRIDLSDTMFPVILSEYGEHTDTSFSPEKFRNIVHTNVDKDETVIAASLWLPWRQDEGIVYNETVKIASIASVVNDLRLDYSIGSYGSLVYEGILEEIHRSCDNGWSLFNKLGGAQRIVYGNCNMIPSGVWRKLLNCNPLDDNPLIWVDSSGNPILHFEYIACPTRTLPQQAYTRQPILFRWLCNKKWLDSSLQRLMLRSYVIAETEPYPKFRT